MENSTQISFTKTEKGNYEGIVDKLFVLKTPKSNELVAIVMGKGSSFISDHKDIEKGIAYTLTIKEEGQDVDEMSKRKRAFNSLIEAFESTLTNLRSDLDRDTRKYNDAGLGDNAFCMKALEKLRTKEVELLSAVDSLKEDRDYYNSLTPFDIFEKGVIIPAIEKQLEELDDLVEGQFEQVKYDIDRAKEEAEGEIEDAKEDMKYTYREMDENIRSCDEAKDDILHEVNELKSRLEALNGKIEGLQGDLEDYDPEHMFEDGERQFEDKFNRLYTSLEDTKEDCYQANAKRFDVTKEELLEKARKEFNVVDEGVEAVEK